MIDSRDVPNHRWYPENPEYAALDRNVDKDAIAEYEHDLSGTLALLHPGEESGE